MFSGIFWSGIARLCPQDMVVCVNTAFITLPIKKIFSENKNHFSRWPSYQSSSWSFLLHWYFPQRLKNIFSSNPDWSRAFCTPKSNKLRMNKITEQTVIDLDFKEVYCFFNATLARNKEITWFIMKKHIIIELIDSLKITYHSLLFITKA